MKLPDLKPALAWLKSVYSEPDGSGSSTRVHIGLIIGFVIGAGVSLLVSVHHKLLTVEQFNSFLGAAGTFVMATAGTLYGVNKAGSFLDGRNKQDKDDQP